MRRYFVTIQEVWERAVYVDALNEKDAIQKARDHDFKTDDQEAFDFQRYLDEDMAEETDD